MVKYTTYKRVTSTTGWKSPKKVDQNNNYGQKQWQDLQNLLYPNDNTYAIINDGVTQNTPSSNITFTQFDFNIPSLNELIIESVDVKIRVMNDTQGGGNIKDDLLRISDNTNNDGQNPENNIVKNEYWDTQKITENKYEKDDWLQYSLTREIINTPNFGFVYRCRGTNNTHQIPLLYSFQVKINYSYMAEVTEDVKTDYNITAKLSSNIIQKVGDTITLNVTRYVLNNQNGVINDIHIQLTDNLLFADGTNQKIIPARNTNNRYDETTSYTIIGKTAGKGTVKITSNSIPEPINLLVLIATNNPDISNKIITLDKDTFTNMTATERGGGYFNGNDSIVTNPTFKNNTAGINNTENYYDAKTIITPVMEDEYEINKTANFYVKVENNDNTFQSNTPQGQVTLYEAGTPQTTVPLNNGKAIFNWTPNTLGNTTLTFKYNGNGIIHSKSSTDKVVKVTKMNTNIKLDTSIVVQKSYFSCTLKNSEGEPLSNQIINIKLSRYSKNEKGEYIYNSNGEKITSASKTYPAVTDSNGKAYLLITLAYDTYQIECEYTGNEEYNNTITTGELKVSKDPSYLTANNCYHRKGETQYLTGRLFDKTNKGINDKVTITLRNYLNQSKQYTINTNDNGDFNLPITWNLIGAFAADIDYPSAEDNINDKTYEPSSTSAILFSYDTGTISSSITLNETQIETTVNETFTLSGTLQDTTSKQSLKNATIDFIVFDSNNKSIISLSRTTTNDKGQFELEYDLFQSDSYIFYAMFPGDEIYDGCLTSTIVNVNNIGNTNTIIEADDYCSTVGSGENYTIRLIDTEGNPIPNRIIHWKLALYGGYKSYTETTDNDGYATLKINAEPNVFDITTSFIGDKIYGPTSITKTLVIQNNTGTTKTHFATRNPEHFQALEGDRYKYYLYNERDWGIINAKTSITLTNIRNKLQKTYCGNDMTNEKGEITADTFTNADGSGFIDINLAAGLYWVQLNYTGTNTYKPTQYKELLFVEKNEGLITQIESDDMEVYEGEERYYTATLKDDTDTPLTDKLIVTHFVGIGTGNPPFYTTNITDDDGQIKQRLQIPPGIYKVTSYYSQSGDYRSCKSNTNTILVIKNRNTKPTKITGTDLEDIIYDNDEYFSVTLTDVITEEPIPNAEVVFNLENEDGEHEIFTKYTDNDGIAQFLISQYAGEYIVNYTFIGDAEYNQSIGSNTLTVTVTESKITSFKAYDTTLTYNNGNIYFKLLSEGNILNNATVNLELIHETFGSIYTDTITTGNGANAIPLNNNIIVGTYTGILTYNGDTDHTPTSTTFTLKVQPPNTLYETALTVNNTNIETTYTESYELITRITTDETPSQLIGHRIQYRFQNRKGLITTLETTINTLETGGYGSILNLNNINGLSLPGGYYDVTITYPLQTNYSASTIENITIYVKPMKTQITGDDTSITYASGDKFPVQVTDKNNTPIPNTYVIFTIGNYIFNDVTDNEGYAYCPIEFPIGQYLVNYRVENNENYNESTGSNSVIVELATTILNISNKTVYYGDGLIYHARLTHNGLPLTGKIIRLELTKDGYTQKYTGTTDKKGNMSPEPLYLDTGTWTAKAYFDGDNGYESCTSNNATINIIIKPTHITVGDLTQDYTIPINLSDINEQPLTGKTITATVNSIEETEEESEEENPEENEEE